MKGINALSEALLWLHVKQLQEQMRAYIEIKYILLRAFVYPENFSYSNLIHNDIQTPNKIQW